MSIYFCWMLDNYFGDLYDYMRTFACSNLGILERSRGDYGDFLLEFDVV